MKTESVKKARFMSLRSAWLFCILSLLGLPGFAQCPNGDLIMDIATDPTEFGKVFDLCIPGAMYVDVCSSLEGQIDDLNFDLDIPMIFEFAGNVRVFRGNCTDNAPNEIFPGFTVVSNALNNDVRIELDDSVTMNLGTKVRIEFDVVSSCGNFPAPDETDLDVDFSFNTEAGCFHVDERSVQMNTEVSSLLPTFDPAAPMYGPGETFTWTLNVDNEGFGDATAVEGTILIGPELTFNGISSTTLGGLAAPSVSTTISTLLDGSTQIDYVFPGILPGGSSAPIPLSRRLAFDLDLTVKSCDANGMVANATALTGCDAVICSEGAVESSVVLTYDQPNLVNTVSFDSDSTQDTFNCTSYTTRYSACNPLQITSVISNDSAVAATNVVYRWEMYSANDQEQFLENINAFGSDPAMMVTVTTRTFGASAQQVVHGGYTDHVYWVEVQVDAIPPGETLTLFMNQTPTCPYYATNDVNSGALRGDWWGHEHRRSNRYIGWEDSCGTIIEDNQTDDNIQQWRTLNEFVRTYANKIQNTPQLGAGECGVIQPKFRVSWWSILYDCDDGLVVDVEIPAALDYSGGNILFSNETHNSLVATMVEGVDFTFDPLTHTFSMPLNVLLRNSVAASRCSDDWHSLTLPVCVADPCVGGTYDVIATWRADSCCGCEYIIDTEKAPIVITCPGCVCGVSAVSNDLQRTVNGVLQSVERGLPGDIVRYTDMYRIAGDAVGCCLDDVVLQKEFWSSIGDAQPQYDNPVLVYQPGSATITVTRASGAIETYSFEPTCLENAPSHPDDGEGDGTGDASGYCFWDLGAEGITLCGGDTVDVVWDAQVNCYGPTPQNENILDWAYSVNSGYDRNVAATGCGPAAHYYDLVKYWLDHWDNDRPNSDTGINDYEVEICANEKWYNFDVRIVDDEPSDPFPDEDREYAVNKIATIVLAPGLIYDVSSHARIQYYTRSTNWKYYHASGSTNNIDDATGVPPTSVVLQGDGTTVVQWDFSNLTDELGNPVDIPDDENHRVIIYYGLLPTCDYHLGDCVSASKLFDGDDDCEDHFAQWQTFDSCGRERVGRWNSQLPDARGELRTTLSPVSQDVDTTDLNCWVLQIENLGEGRTFNTWAYLELADDIVIDSITNLTTGAAVTNWFVTNDNNDVYFEVGDLTGFGDGRVGDQPMQVTYRICGHLEDTTGNGNACDTGFDEREIGLTSWVGWGCEFPGGMLNPTNLADTVCQVETNSVEIKLLEARMQVEKIINPPDADPITLCEPFPMIINLRNTGFTDGFDLQVWDLPPPGVRYITNSAVVWVTDVLGNSNSIPVTCSMEPTSVSDFGFGANRRQLIRWNFCSDLVLGRGEVLSILFQGETTCDFIAGRSSFVIPSMEAPCGQRIFLREDYASPAAVLEPGEQADFPNLEVDLRPIDGDGCGEGTVMLSFTNLPGNFPGGNPANNMQVIQVLPIGVHFVSGSSSALPVLGGISTVDPFAYCVQVGSNGVPFVNHLGTDYELRIGLQPSQEVLIWELDDIDAGDIGTVTYNVRADVNCDPDGRILFNQLRFTSPKPCAADPSGVCNNLVFEDRQSNPFIERRADIVTEATSSEEGGVCFGEDITFTLNGQNVGDGFADNFKLVHEFDASQFSFVGASHGGAVVSPGRVEWAAGLTGRSDADADGLLDELDVGDWANADMSPVSLTIRFVNPATCSQQITVTNSSFASWGCDNLPSLGGCPEAPDSPGGEICGVDVPFEYGIELWCTDVTLEKRTNGEDADVAPGVILSENDAVSWTYVITNTGNTVLGNIIVTDDREGVASCPNTQLAPGETMTCTLTGTAACGLYANTATLSADNIGYNGDLTPTTCPVAASDLSHYFGDCANAVGIELQKSVYTGHDGGLSCPGGELAYGTPGSDVTYCFVIINTGATPLTNIELLDTDLDPDFAQSWLSPFVLMPGQAVTTHTETVIAGDLMNVAEVVGTPSDTNGVPVTGLPPVTNDNPAAVDEVNPGIELQKTVYAGQNAGASCPGTELVVDDPNAAVTYCFRVENIGDVHLATVQLGDTDVTPNLSTNLSTLAPGDVVWVYLETSINGNLTNIADVSGVPATPAGVPFGTDPVLDSDPAEVVEASPGIALRKTVALGHNATCEGSEVVSNINNAPVTYCFVVVNTGDTYLNDVMVIDTDLDPDVSIDIGLMAPGQSVTNRINTNIDGDLNNVAGVIGTPSDESGDPYDLLDDVTDMDDANVDEVLPSIQLSKTVYASHDGGTSCPGTELVNGIAGQPVTYCFRVENTGETHLQNVMLTDDDVSPAVTMNLGLLAPGEVVWRHLDSSITGDLTNTADVAGTPSDSSGASFTTNTVTDMDPAEVNQINPSIEVLKTVYDSHDGGASCPGGELVSDVPGHPVTYCFEVINTGDSFLSNVTLTDDDVTPAFTHSIGLLAPGSSAWHSVETIIAGDLVNTADAVGTPSSPSGTPWSTNTVEDSDPATVDEINPSVALGKTVYAGHNSGADCSGAESVAVAIGQPITYCFAVTNTGDTFLSDVTVTDPLLGTSTNLGIMAPAQVIVSWIETSSIGTLTNIADVSGTPSTPTGDPLGPPPVIDEDPAEVDELTASIELAKSVYLGHDLGAACNGSELVTGSNGTLITYCFEITNTGNTDLLNVTVNDDDIEPQFTANIGLLAAGATEVIYTETAIDGDLTNIADVVGTPVDSSGTPISGLPDVTDDDPAEVDEIPPEAVGLTPGILLAKTVYAGHDGGVSCEGLELVTGLLGSDVTYCFEITNTGDTWLADIVLIDNDLSTPINVNLGGPLAPGASLPIFSVEDTLAADLVNTASVSGLPSDDAGTPLGLRPVDDDDPAEVDSIDPALTNLSPGVSIDKTVYQGHNAGASCPGSERVNAVLDSDVTYCFTVTNTGDTWLVDVMIDDSTIGFTTNVGLLVPGQSVSVYTESTLATDLINIADVSGQPADTNGVPVDLPPVTDDDPAEVNELTPGITLSKTVTDAGSACPGGDLLVNSNGHAITYCFVIENTGETHLSSVTLTDNDLTPAILMPLGLLAPGDVLTVSVDAVISGDLTNTANVLGLPAEPSGTPIDSLDPVIDDDPAVVDEVPPESVGAAPGIAIAKTVYLGHNTGASCPGSELVAAVPASDVTYCFTVMNTGNVALVDVTIVDNDISPAYTNVIPGILPVGGSVTRFVETSLTADLVNTASVTGVAADPSGTPLPQVPTVSDEDPAEVDALVPHIELRKTVYAGNLGLAGCPGNELEVGPPGQVITYCFIVENTGDTPLSNVVIDDNFLSPPFTIQLLGTLMPGDVVTNSIADTITGTLINIASVNGTPTDPAGTPLGLPDVDDTDDAEVAELIGNNPGIELRKTVYGGHDGGSSCEGSEIYYGTLSDLVTYCFVAVNTGDTYLADVTVTDTDITPNATFNLGTLAPGQTGTAFVATAMFGDLTNRADVVGTPSDSSGNPTGDLPVMDDDEAVVIENPPAIANLNPGIELHKTVYAGHDNGASCPGTELEINLPGTPVTYCFVVCNTGDSYLANIQLVDDSITPPFDVNLGLLAPGACTTTRVQHAINGNLTNIAGVVGVPSDSNGFPFILPPVGDDDPAVVREVNPSYMLVKSVLSPVGRAAAIGETVQFEIRITNTGDTDLQTVPLTDAWDASLLSYSGATPSPDTVASGALAWNDLGTLTPGNSHVVLVTMTALSSGSDVNTAVTAPTTPPSHPPVPPQTNTPPYDVSNPGFSLVKALVAPLGRAAAIGEEVVFSITLTNTGDVPLATTPLSDTWDASYLAFGSAFPAPNSFSAGSLIWNDLGSLAPGNSHSVTVTMTALASTPAGGELNTAIASPTTPPTQPPVPPQTNTPPYEVSNPGFELIKSLTSPAGRAAAVGETVTFEITITNTGDVLLTSVPLTDTWDNSLLSFSSASPAATTVAAGSLAWADLGSLAPGNAHTVTVEMIALASGSDVNTAVTAPTTPPTEPPVPPQTNTPPFDVRQPGYVLSKTLVSPLGRAAAIGEELVFQITVLNTGDVTLATVPLTDTWDATYLSFASAVPAPTTSAAGSLAWADLGSLAPGNSHTVTVTMSALAETPAGGELNTATTAPTTPPSMPPVPPQTSEPPYTISNPSFSLEKTLTSPLGRAAAIGETVTFRIRVTNTGNIPLTTVPLTDTWNASYLSYMTATPAPSSVAPGSLAWTDLGSIAAGASRDVNVTMTAIASTPAAGELNTAIASPTTPPTQPPVPPQTNTPPYEISSPAFELTKTLVSPLGRAAGIGEELVFEIRIENTGDINLQTVPLTDTWDANLLSLVSASPAPTSSSAGNLVWSDLGSLTPGNTHTVLVTMQALAAGDDVNSATTSPTTPPGQPPVPPQTSTPPYEIVSAGFTLVKQVTSPIGRAAAIGESVIFQIVITNTGTVDLASVPLTDTWDTTYLSYVSATPVPTFVSPGELEWSNIGTLTPGNSHIVTVEMTAISSGTDVNTAIAAPTTPPTAPPVPPQTNTPPYEISGPAFVLTKTLLSPVGRAAAVGEELVFEIRVQNTGDINLQTVPLTDTWDASLLRFVSASPAPTSSSAGNLAWSDLGSLAPGNSHVVTVSMTALASGSDVNSATASPTTPPSQPPVPPQTSTPPYTISNPSFSLVKTLTSPLGRSAGIGENLSFSITVQNTGDVTLQSVPLTDTWDASLLSFVSASPAQSTTTAGTASWANLGALVPGASHTVTVTMTALAAGTDVNTAVASPTTPPGQPPVPPQTNTPPYTVSNPAFTLTKSLVSPLGRAAAVGEQVVFDITVQNTGDVMLQSVPVIDTWDASLLSVVSASPAASSSATGSLTWNNIGPLAPDNSASITVTMLALASGSDVNTAVTAPTTPPTAPPVPPQTNTPPFVVSNPSFSLLKTLTSPLGRTAGVGESLTFQIQVTNTGDVNLQTVPLTDTWDASLLGFVTASPAPTSSSAGSLSWANLGSLAPGASHTVNVTMTALASGTDVNSATAAPTTPPGQPPVPPQISEPPFTVVDPSVAITKTRISPAGVAQLGQQVVFRITVQNTGDISLPTVFVSDTWNPAYLDFSSATVAPDVFSTPGYTEWANLGGPLAPGASASVDVTFNTLAVTSGNDMQLNVAVVTPTTPPNNPPAPPATNDAPYNIYNPSISIRKTVYAGHNNGASCPGSDFVQVTAASAVTYCFVVQNTGDTRLDNVTITDSDLSPTVTLTIPTLAAGASATRFVERTSSGDLVNTASVTGTPTDLAGTPLGLTPPTDDDTAEVDEVAPSIAINKTVYAGQNGGASCPGSELVQVAAGSAVTYCFVVQNTGDTPLQNVLVTDNDVSPVYSTTIANLSPGQSMTVFTQRTSSGDLVNTASATGTPTGPGGNPIPGVPTPTDSDTAEVDEVMPNVTISKTVYAGHNSGASCPGSELVYGIAGSDVTYCFVVQNTGDVHLNNVTITDNNLSPAVSITVGLLAPGASATRFVEHTISGDLMNTASVTGTPSTSNGTPIPGVPAPSDSDTAEVDQIAPGLVIHKTVYAGHDDGDSCPGSELVTGEAGDTITYCFTVQNTGDTFLNNITVVDNDIVPALNVNLGFLAPGATADVFVETTISGDLLNTASASGTPTSNTGTPLPGAPSPSDSDTAQVDQIAPGISINKTVYEGHNSGASCAGSESITADANAPVTYCFVIQNTGDTFLSDVTITDNDVTPVVSMNIGILAPGATTTRFVERTINGDLLNTAGVTGTPSTNAGTPLPGITAPSDSDTAEVTEAAGLASLGDRVWEDLNANGIQDAGEPGLDGITVRLYNNAGGLVGTTTTAGGGGYLFSSLNPGSYRVEFVLPNGSEPSPTGIGTDGSIDSDANAATSFTALIPLAGGENNLTIDAGIYTPVELGGATWIDLDADGRQDSNEPILQGVTVNLFNASGTLINSQVTGPSGSYLFPNLTPGDYTVGFVNPGNGYTHTIQDASTNESIDSDANATTGITANIPLDSGNSIYDIDAGFIPPPANLSLGSHLFLDADNNGIFDPGEEGIPFAFIFLFLDSDGSGDLSGLDDLINVDFTGFDGSYRFDNLAAGNYILQVTADNFQPGGALYASDALVSSIITAGDPNNDINDDDNGFPIADGSVVTAPITLIGGSEPVGEPDDQTGANDNMTLDLGFFIPLSIGGIVAIDPNDSGTLTGEVPGVVVELYTTNQVPGVSTPVGITTTAPDGTFVFDNLPPGDYQVFIPNPPEEFPISSSPEVTNPTDNQQPGDDNGVQETPGGSVISPVISLISSQEPQNGGSADLTIGFGFFTPVEIGDRVWFDLNLDGVQNSNEGGVPDIAVLLYEAGNPDPVAQTTTDANGNYHFGNLSPGNYQVVFDPSTFPEGAEVTVPNLGGDDSLDSDADSNGVTPFTGTLAGGTIVDTIDLGLWQPVYIGDSVWVDISNNGDPSDENLAELGINGVQVELYLVENGSETLVGQTVTATIDGELGQYLFGPLTPGNYIVRVESQENSDYPISTTPTEYGLNAQAGDTITDADFGFIQDPTAITLASFEAVLVEDGVEIIWDTSWEEGTLGFFVYRLAADGSMTRVNDRLVLSAGSGSGARYSVLDAGAIGGRYKLEEITTDLLSELQEPEAVPGVPAAPLGGATLTVAAEDGEVDLQLSDAWKSVLSIGFAQPPIALDVTNPDSPLRLEAELLETTSGFGLYFSYPAGSDIEIR